MPPARPFPEQLFFAAPWDLREECIQLVQIQTQTDIRKNTHLLEISEFLTRFPEPRQSFLRTDPINPRWACRFSRKSTLLRWERTALKQSDSITVRGVTARPLSYWLSVSVAEIKAAISPAEAARRQFQCQFIFFTSLQNVIGQHISASSTEGLPHLPLVIWEDEMPVCQHCLTHLNYIQCPDKIYRRCLNASLFQEGPLQQALQSCNTILADLQAIIARF